MTNAANNETDSALIIKRLSIFPLKTVLFPEGPLSLKIFEPRYLDMLTECEKNGTGFGVCLIRDGNETGKAADIYLTGTLAQVTFWENRKDGLLGVSVKGERKFYILDKTIEKNELTVAEIKLVELEPVQAVPEQFLPMVTVLEKIMQSLKHPYITLEKKYNNACWVGSRLGELLPLSLEKKQQLLEMNEANARLAMLYEEMLTMGILSE